MSNQPIGHNRAHKLSATPLALVRTLGDPAEMCLQWDEVRGVIILWGATTEINR